MLFVLPWWVTLIASLVATAAAFARGGRAERLVGALTVAHLIWDHAHHYTYGTGLARALAHDSVAAILMTIVALRVNRYWTVGAASAWLMSAATDIVQMAAPVDAWALGTAQLVWYYVFLLCLGVGAWRTPSVRSESMALRAA
jgi:hypothetical protein